MRTIPTVQRGPTLGHQAASPSCSKTLVDGRSSPTNCANNGSGVTPETPLRTVGDPSTGFVPAAWWLYADTEGELFDLYAELWPCHGAPVRIDAPNWPGAVTTRRFRKRFPTAPRA